MVVAFQNRSVDPDTVDCTRAKCVALTFDDGPTPLTDRLLRVLTADDAKAAFFLVGNKVAADPASNGYHLVTVGHLLGPREPGGSYGSRVNGPPAHYLADIPADQIPALPPTPSPAPARNLPITDIPNQNPGGPQ
uniref:polysaccharide deacetylase family protein n=1 Tax=Mycolicibacterium sp. TUM20985 TaxID=3023370 RepID=UPI002573B12B|nr:polysaccharide deacetylase family protein [Mycolicibacterium sp. TUM20985]